MCTNQETRRAKTEQRLRRIVLRSHRRGLNGHVRPRFPVSEAMKARCLKDLEVGSVL